jgi:tryptophan-rich sensory protein
MNKDTKIGAVLLIAFVVLFVPPLVDVILYLFGSYGPFLVWRVAFEEIKLAKWQMVCYVVFLWVFAFSFLYYGARRLVHKS